MSIVQPRLVVQVALLPSFVPMVGESTCVVVDVLRAATSLSIMAETGIGEVVIAPDPPAARSIARSIGPPCLLCGESDGIKPDDFDRGNSPNAYRDSSILGRPIVFCSSNGARAMHQLAGADVLLVGALVNARHVAQAVVDVWNTRRHRVFIVCSGNGHGQRFSLEDTFCAGLIVSHLVELTSRASAHLDDGAMAALRLYQSYRSTVAPSRALPSLAVARMFAESAAARKLRRWGLDDDVQACGAVDSVRAVMAVTVVGDRLIARPLRIPD